ncbi:MULTISPECIES: FkbM family methyltransferase [Bradyrhizobium]|uniref:FkbM family methyltransferase n=1 Tax=Bradyrhizobium TaxID=374 RepID=UPI001AD62802|nr:MULTISPECIES: FkbM family methyltransferase [Bradyrhizobium]MBO4228180.1 FkbM family methyltransferase [Bradyrhizobium neotropicale]MCA1457343.1 FkbM family methyltransferase [Bradyrhizobium sp. BRP22]
MIAMKTARFLGKYALSDPFKLADIVRRRAIEQFSSAPSRIAITHFNGVQYELDMSLHRMMKKYFFHTHEMFLERIFERCLPPGTIFVDIGANCGYWSAYAASLVGPTGEVHAFEPVPQYFRLIRRLAQLNPAYRILANQIACGARSERLSMAVVAPRANNFDNYDTNIGSSSLAAGFLDHVRELTEAIAVSVIPFDAYVREHNLDLDRIGLIKIDVEGFESAVFDGMYEVLAHDGRKVPILCEILTDRTRAAPLDGRIIIERLEASGYRCLDATHLRPINRNALGFEENIFCC